MEQANQLVQLCGIVFRQVEEFKRHDSDSDFDLMRYRQKVNNAFINIDRIANEEQISLHKVSHAKYALMAFIDELVIRSGCQNNSIWMAKPLQLEFFGEHLAGEGFFNRLSELRQNANQHIDVIEVYYLCLQMGFEGIYRKLGCEKLTLLVSEVHRHIESTRGVCEQQLSKPRHNKKALLQNASQEIPYWVFASVTAALVFIIYLGFSFAIGGKASNIVQDIEQAYHAKSSINYYRS